MKIRSFLAFDISEDVKKELSGLIELLRSKCGVIKWIRPELMHCTMKFFGDVEEELLLGKLTDKIASELTGQKSLRFDVVGVGVFPNWRYPRIVWAGLTGDTQEAIDLHTRLERALALFGFKKDERALRLHLTLGRTKAPLKKCETFIGLVEKLADKKIGSFTVDHLTLYKSVLTREGPIYTPLKEFKLKEK